MCIRDRGKTIEKSKLRLDNGTGKVKAIGKATVKATSVRERPKQDVKNCNFSRRRPGQGSEAARAKSEM